MDKLDIRVFVKKDKQMIDLGHIYEINFYDKTITLIYDNYEQMEQELEEFNLDEVVIYRYTGLKDQREREIYEEHIGYDETRDIYGLIEFEEGCYRFNWEDISEPLSEVHQDIQMIGTTFDYPKLLKE